MTKPALDASTDASLDYSTWQLKVLLRLALDDAGGASTGGSDPITGGLARALSPEITLEQLRGLKAEAKASIEGSSGPTRDTAKLLYHLTVAVAIARFGVNISRIPSQKRLDLYRGFADAFSGHPIGKVFAAAAKA